MYHQYRYEPGPYDDDFEDQPGQSWFHKWVLGIGAAGFAVVCGVAGIIAREGTLSGQTSSIHLSGASARALGVAWLSAGLFAHFHYFWGNIYNQAWFAVLGKVVSAIAFVVAMGIMLARVGIYGH